MKKILLTSGIITILAFGSCDVNSLTRKYEITNHEELSIPYENAEKLELINSVGDISIEYADTDEVKMIIDYTFSGNNEEKLYQFEKGFHPLYDINSDCLNIRFSADSNENNINTDADIKLLIPESFSEFNLSSSVGNINLNELKGSFDLTESVGNINLNDIVITGDTSIMADVGDVNMTLKGVEKTNADISVNVGNVHIKNNNTEFEVQSEQKETTGEKKHFVVDGKCEFDVSVSVGKISLE